MSDLWNCFWRIYVFIDTNYYRMLCVHSLVREYKCSEMGFALLHDQYRWDINQLNCHIIKYFITLILGFMEENLWLIKF